MHIIIITTAIVRKKHIYRKKVTHLL